MSAASGIAVSDDLVQSFNAAINHSRSVRFIVSAIRNESIVLDQIVEPRSTLDDDLSLLQNILSADTPAYILAKLDGSNPVASHAWLAISYVPDIANIRAKMLYASSRAALTKGLGSGYFVDTLFATSKADLTPEAYAAHRAHNAAPRPLSDREKEIEEARAAEKGTDTVYEGSRARKNHVGHPVGFSWDPKAEHAIQSFATSQISELVVLTIDAATETLVLHSQSPCMADEIGSQLPPSDAAYALFRWQHTEDGQNKQDVVFIYSCPTTSPVKLRMLYSSGTSSLVHAIQNLLGAQQSIAKRIELSEPKEFNESFIRSALGYQSIGNDAASATPERTFARPRAPKRQR